MRRLVAGLLLAGATVAPAPARAQVVADPTVGAPGLDDPYYPDDGNGGYRVEHYDLTLGYDPPSRQLTGTARLSAIAAQPLRAFDLDFSGPAVRTVTVNGRPATFERTGAHKLAVTPVLPLLPGLPFAIVVDYAGEAADSPDSGWTLSPSGGAFAAGEPHSAATWYPLNDTPLDKATFEVRVTVPPEWEVVSNGVRVSDVADGTHRTVDWRLRDPVAGYLTTVAIDHFEFLDQRRVDGTPLFSAFAPQAVSRRDLETKLPEVLDFLETLYGPYPFESGGGIYVDTDLQFSLETQTRPIYAPWSDLNTVVHENTHQWWGDSMSVRQWADICLNECFASYTADYLWPERKDGKDVDAMYRETIDKNRGDPSFWQTPLQNPGAGREFTAVYTRGPLFLHALRHLLGDAVFFPAMSRFVQAHRYDNASMPEFRAYLQSLTPIGLGGFLDAWLDRTVIPPDAELFPGSLSLG
ncbi:M1 family metallopeptidase [Nocardia sp. alder85J]|uniref:M1 family metallopeptidase n=1 Tax=Nocardia sp. alder85J TaxID=2862949 RepID=UPI001CD23375|nr:M1 family metallopeptidase [Nocardia sp. alder85J]MCX4093325.1 M1 family metallopeptidase [Nocardia sp. alder85J]